jgi:hypothetical protein
MNGAPGFLQLPQCISGHSDTVLPVQLAWSQKALISPFQASSSFSRGQGGLTGMPEIVENLNLSLENSKGRLWQ